MDPSIFQPMAPGKLVPATGYDASVGSGTIRQPVEGWAFVPNPLPPILNSREFHGDLVEPLLRAERALARLDTLSARLPNKDLLLSPFRLREARLSSQIEDTFATAEQIAMQDLEEAPPGSDTLEVWNYVRALDHGLGSPLPLCNRLIREMHEILLRGVRGDEHRPGEFRTIQVCIGNREQGFRAARFVPPPPGPILTECLNDLERFLNRSPDAGEPRFQPLIELAMSHYQFECIHPFADGNGRLGRLLIALALHRGSTTDRPVVYISAFLDKHRQRYYDLLLRVSTHGDWVSWVEFMLEAIATQTEDACHRANALEGLRERYRAQAKHKRASTTFLDAVDRLFMRPALNASSLARALNKTPQAAQKYINDMVDLGMIREVTGGSYGRRYVATEILRVADGE